MNYYLFITRCYFIIAISILLYYFYRYIALIHSYSFDIGGHEEFIVYYIRTFLESGDLYFPVKTYPYTQTIYTPLYFYLTSSLYKLFNSDIIDIRAIYMTGRYINMVFNIGSCLIIYLIGKRIQLKPPFLLIAIIFFLFHLPEHNIAIRPDAMKDFFLLFSLLTNIYWYQSGKKAFLGISLIAAIISVFTKQDAIIYIMGFQFAMFLFGLYRKSICYVSILIILTTIILLMLNIYSGYTLFENIFFANIDFSWDFIPRWLLDIKSLAIASIIPLSVICIALFRHTDYPRVLIFTLGIFFLLSLISGVKFGAAGNYYTHFYIILGIAFTYCLQKLKWIYAITALTLTFILNFHIPPAYSSIEKNSQEKYFYEMHTICSDLHDKYRGARMLILDQTFLLFLPFKTVIMAQNTYYYHLLYTKYGFEGKNTHVISDLFTDLNLLKIISEVDLLIMERNERSEILFKDFYSDYFLFNEHIGHYNIYLKNNHPHFNNSLSPITNASKPLP